MSQGPQYTANIVNLSTGQILFADPSLPWNPNNFPTLPSTSLSVTAIGRIQDRNISTLSLTNAIVYEPFEPTQLRSSLSKTLQINNSGVVTYSEPKVSFVSTYSGAFTKSVSSFTPSTIGGANINDITTGNPDTITNALAKLDGWITNAFLTQPPVVTMAEVEHTSLYGGIRWLNFTTYPILDKFIPYVTSILFIVGDPSTANYCTFEISDPIYFPYKSYTNGISPANTPLVRFRIYTDFFFTQANRIYTKASMQTACLRLITESGAAVFPETGKVLAIENTNGSSTYTTLSIFLPNLTQAYPKGTQIPIQIIYMNKTETQPNVAQINAQIQLTGGPSAPSSMTGLVATSASVQVQIVKPTYSDSLANISSPYFSTYTTSYTMKRMNTVFGNTGFRYGIPSPTSTPDFLSSVVNSTFTQSDLYQFSTQAINITSATIVPGIQLSTSAKATNLAYISGPPVAGPIVSTLFPATKTSTISNTRLINTAQTQTVPATRSTVNIPIYTNKWQIATPLSRDVMFLSTVTPLTFQLSTLVQLNDASYPGDRNTMTITSKYINPINGTYNKSLYMNPVSDDFVLNTTISTVAGANRLNAYITDNFSTVGSQKYYYNAMFSGIENISTISTQPQSIQMIYTNRTINQSTVVTQIKSTPVYSFTTDIVNPCVNVNILYNNNITNVTQIAGIYTPSLDSVLYFDLQASNIGNMIVGSTFATAQLGKNVIDMASPNYVNAQNCWIGPQSNYVSAYIYNGPTEVTSLPFPQNTLLTLSSCSLMFNSNAYQDPNDPKPIYIAATITPAAPQAKPEMLLSSFSRAMYVDTLSLNTYMNFTDTEGAYGQRIVSLLPRSDAPGTSNNMHDGVDSNGFVGSGLNVAISTFISLAPNNTYTLSTGIYYNHSSNLSSVYTNNYSRELLYSGGHYIHTAGFNFSQFNPAVLGIQNKSNADFTYDLVYDQNYGYRYATFAYESQIYSTPTTVQYLYVTLVNPSFLGTITTIRSENTCFPDYPVDPTLVQYMKVRMHVKALGTYPVSNVLQTVETAWVNGFKSYNNYAFADNVYDVGACGGVSVIGSNVQYRVMLSTRNYSKICPIVRIGIAQDGSVYSGDPITFDAIQVSLSNH